METIEYKLKSNPEKSVSVPADYASKAESLVKLAMENPFGLADSVSEHPYLVNAGILARTMSLASTRNGTPESIKLQDEVYLRVCIYGNEQNMRGLVGLERDEAMGLDGTLIQMVQDL